MQIAVSFDADCNVFQRNFTSHFGLSSAIIWLPKYYNTKKNSTYLERRRLPFQIRELWESNCKYPWNTL